MDLDRLKIDRPRPQLKLQPGARTAAAGAAGGGWGRALRRTLTWIIVLGALGGGAYVFREPALRLIDQVRLEQVRLARVEEATEAAAQAARGISANGYVVADRRAALSADTPGRVVELRVNEGSRVSRGDVVARLYADEYAAALQRAERELEVARRAVSQASATLAATGSAIERLERSAQAAARRIDAQRTAVTIAARRVEQFAMLVERDAANQSQLDDAKDELIGARAQVAALEAELAAARAAVDNERARQEAQRQALAVAEAQVDVAQAAKALASATLDKTVVRAPFDGIVVLVDAEIGEVVSPSSGGGSNARGSVATMVDMASLEAQVDLPEASLGKIQVGAPASIFLDAYPGQAYAGKVSRIWPEANRQKATIEVRVTFDAPDDRLRPELGVRVVFRDEGEAAPVEPSATREPTQGKSLMLPEAALIRDGGADKVWVVERGVARLRAVEVVARSGGRATVASGVAAGDEVIVEPPARLRDGDRVRVIR